MAHNNTLVLNADYTVLKMISWKKAFLNILPLDCWCIRGGYADIGCPTCHGAGFVKKATTLVNYDDFIKDGSNNSYKVPAVIVLDKYVNTHNRRIVCSKNNIVRRDRSVCQYCSTQLAPHEVTMDHVIPRSRWKKKECYTNFHNVVVACMECNGRKGNRTPDEAGMKLLKQPKIPTRKQLTFWRYESLDSTPEEWKPFI